MNKTLLIFKHEFLHTLTRTGFIILSLALPVLALLGIGISHIASGITRPTAETIRIGYVDEAGGFDQFTTQGNISLVRFNNPESAIQALIKKDVNEYFVIPSDYAIKGTINAFTMEKQLFAPADTQSVIKDFLSNNLLTGKVDPDAIKVIQAPLNLVTIRLDINGEVSLDQGGPANIVIPGIFGILLALSLIFSSTYVLQGLGEEKENRLMEILLSSVSARQLVTGKVLGIGAGGLVQVVFWIILLPILLNLASSSIGGFISSIKITPGFLVLGVGYFILGYLLFATLSASVAAVSNSVREGQGLAGIFSMFVFAPFWFFSLLLMFPNSPAWIVFSIFPFSSPVLVMLRLGMTGVPVWQLIISIAVLILSIFGGLLLTAKLLRTYMLMYGKRPGLSEMIRNLKA
jgi:ABC-2 type transport system permease protein